MKKSPLAWWKNILGGFIGAAALEGVIGNRADTVLTLVWPPFQTVVSTNRLFWSIVVPVLVVCIGICVYFIRRNRELERTLALYDKIQKLDDSLLRELTSLTRSQNIEREMKRVVTGLLEDVTAEFDGQIHRAALLLPDAVRVYLNCWANYRMSQESVDNMKFYIGSDQDRRQREGGVAGEVFLTGELQVGHIQRANGTWNCEDCDSYIRLSGRRTSPPYLSFVNVPILSGDPSTPNSSATTCLGIICFDSLDKDVFDGEESLVVLRTFARRVAVALLTFKFYQDTLLPPTQGNSKL